MVGLSIATLIIFLITLIFILWRPKGINEAIPSTIGAIGILLIGSVTFSDLIVITSTISGAAITILATIVMTLVLESFGFFTWVAHRLAVKARGSGLRLFWYVNLLCFLMTLFLNNDGSILITTPILLYLLAKLGLKHHQKIPYLLSGALMATASSAPIGVSNLVNLIALKIVEMDLYMHTLMMFPPAAIGLLVMLLLLFTIFRKAIPRHIPPRIEEKPHILGGPHKVNLKYIKYVIIFILCVRIGLFLASYLGIPVELVAVAGAVLLCAWRWYHLKVVPTDILKKTPWYIFVFAFSMYVIIYGLHNVGLTDLLITLFEPYVSGSLLHASFMIGSLVTILSNLFNNHPALMVSTLTLTNMNLDPVTLKVAYLASVIGSDVGSLILPIGTLATLMWMHIIKKGGVPITWKQYIKVTIIVIPISMFITLFLLYFWVKLLSDAGIY
jgi:arsenical pump membrane protein